MTCVLYYHFLKSYDSFVWRKPTKIIVIIVLYWTVMRIELINCELDQIMNESFRQQIFSQFWYFSRNFEFTSQNSDFFLRIAWYKVTIMTFFLRIASLCLTDFSQYFSNIRTIASYKSSL